MLRCAGSIATVEQRRNIFRGKNLGTAFTSAQKAEIKAGTFKGFFIGTFFICNKYSLTEEWIVPAVKNLFCQIIL